MLAPVATTEVLPYVNKIQHHPIHVLSPLPPHHSELEEVEYSHLNCILVTLELIVKEQIVQLSPSHAKFISQVQLPQPM